MSARAYTAEEIKEICRADIARIYDALDAAKEATSADRDSAVPTRSIEAQMRLRDACVVAEYNRQWIGEVLSSMSAPVLSKQELLQAEGLAEKTRRRCLSAPLAELEADVRDAVEAYQKPTLSLYLRFLPARVHAPLQPNAPIAEINSRRSLRNLLSDVKRVLEDPNPLYVQVGDLPILVDHALYSAEGCASCEFHQSFLTSEWDDD